MHWLLRKLQLWFNYRARLIVLNIVALIPLFFIHSLNDSLGGYSLPVLIGVSLVLLSAGQWWISNSWYQQSHTLRNYLSSQQHIDSEAMSDTQLMETIIEQFENPEPNIRRQLMEFAEQVHTHANDVTNAVALTNQGVSHQKTETENLDRSMEAMLNASQAVTASATDATEAASNAEANAKESAKVLLEATVAIDGLATQVEESTNLIQELANDSDNIGAILDVIKGIAEQTNLLALNAAIEAARAGEQGRGFAVVADEVRSLASRTHESTQEIENMIQRLQQAAQTAASSMGGGKETARQAVEQVSEANNALGAITVAVEHIRSMNSQIAESTDQQTHVAQEIKMNVETIDGVNELTMETLDGLNDISATLISLHEAMQTAAQ